MQTIIRGVARLKLKVWEEALPQDVNLNTKIKWSSLVVSGGRKFKIVQKDHQMT